MITFLLLIFVGVVSYHFGWKNGMDEMANYAEESIEELLD